MKKNTKQGWRTAIQWSVLGATLGGLGLTAACSAEEGAFEDDVRAVEQLATTPVTVIFQQGVSSYTGAQDATIQQGAPTANLGSSATCEVDGDDGGGVDKSCLLGWNVSSIPAGSTVQSVKVRVQIVNESGNTYTIYGLKRSFIEAQATWNQATTGTNWSTGGALGTNDRGASVGTISGAVGSKLVTLNSQGVSLVQSWVDGASTTGFVIAHPTNTNGLDVASSEHATVAYRPALEITYLPAGGDGDGDGTGGPPVPGQASLAATHDATIQEGAPSANLGSALTCEADGDDGGGADKSCLLRFDTASVPSNATVNAARIRLRIVNESSQTYQLYAIKRAFNEAQVTWNQATSSTSWSTPGAQGTADRGAQIGSVSGAVGSTTVTLNAAGRAAVQSWIEGSESGGIIVASTTNTNGIDFATSEDTTAAYRPVLEVDYTVGGSGGGGGQTGASTDPNLLVAFIGDQGNGSNADAVLNLIKNEGAAATVHNGDFDYSNNPTAWENRVNSILGSNYPYFAVIGNHDAASWGGTNGYGAKVAARVARVPSMQCTGEMGVKANCTFRGLHLVQSCVGTNELRSSCGKDSSEQVGFIRDSLANDNAVWEVCSWHKNQRSMQVGAKSDEVGWNAYQECMNGGAMVSTGHEHSYSRTLTLTDVGSGSNDHGAMGAYDFVELGEGKNFVFTSGLAGVGIRTFNTGYHSGDTWWSSYYTSDRWMMNGVMKSGTARYGALFIKFHVDGDPKKATAYFKDIQGRIADQFTIIRE